MAQQAEPTDDVVSASCSGGDGGGSVTVGVAGDEYVTAFASTSMASCSQESSLYVTASLSEVQVRAAIEKSKDQGWSELAKVGTGLVASAGPLSAADAVAWEELKNGYPRLFQDNVKVKLGQLIAEGGQAQIYEVEVIKGDLKQLRYLAKVFKMDGFSLVDFQRQWPFNKSSQWSIAFGIAEPTFGQSFDYCTSVDCGLYLEDGRFAFLMERCWGDLQTLIDLQLQNKNSQGPPFSDLEAMKIM